MHYCRYTRLGSGKDLERKCQFLIFGCDHELTSAWIKEASEKVVI
jgi:hypothetical protein